jgi:hypothetical protein
VARRWSRTPPPHPTYARAVERVRGGAVSDGGGGEQWGRDEAGRNLRDKSGRVDRFLGRMVRLVARTIWGLVKLIVKSIWRLLRPSKDPAKKRARSDRAA